MKKIHHTKQGNLLGYHPAYGLPDELRLRAIERSYKTSLVEAGQYYHVHPVTICNWRKRLKKQGTLT